MKANQDKCSFSAKFWHIWKTNSGSQKLFGVPIDWELNFNKHVTNLCDKEAIIVQ